MTAGRQEDGRYRRRAGRELVRDGVQSSCTGQGRARQDNAAGQIDALQTRHDGLLPARISKDDNCMGERSGIRP